MKIEVQPETLEAFVTVSGLAREARVCHATIKKKLLSGEIKASGVLVESQKQNSFLFRASEVPEILLALGQSNSKSHEKL
jgi:hypothetical protein